MLLCAVLCGRRWHTLGAAGWRETLDLVHTFARKGKVLAATVPPSNECVKPIVTNKTMRNNWMGDRDEGWNGYNHQQRNGSSGIAIGSAANPCSCERLHHKTVPGATRTLCW